MSRSAYLVIRSNAAHACFQKFCDDSKGHGETLVAARAIHDVVALEPGTRPWHTWIGKYSSMDAAKTSWDAMQKTPLEQLEPPLVLALEALQKGDVDDPDVPTQWNVPRVVSQPPTLMLIEGTVADAVAIESYRAVILPMIKARGAYYSAFAFAPEIKVLSGRWSEGMFAISRWPAAHLAYDFWLSDLYQKTAIPHRMGISRFEVVVMEGERDDG